MCIGGVCLSRAVHGHCASFDAIFCMGLCTGGRIGRQSEGVMKAYIAVLTLGLATQDAKINPACTDAKIQNFPSWIINGKVAEGDQTFDQLEKLLLQ